MRDSPELGAFAVQLFHAAAGGDSSLLRDAFADEPGVLVIGTDPAEWWSGAEAIQQALSASQADEDAVTGVIADAEAVAYEDGSLGWGACRGTVEFPGQAPIPLRVTFVCQRQEGVCRIVQWHVSIGVPNQDAFHEAVIIQAG